VIAIEIRTISWRFQFPKTAYLYSNSRLNLLFLLHYNRMGSDQAMVRSMAGVAVKALNALEPTIAPLSLSPSSRCCYRMLWSNKKHL
jgi:hypothetical protein